MPLSATRSTVLILDDEPGTVELAARVLRGDHAIIEARSGAEALARADGSEISVALVDQRMPEMTGLEFLLEFGKSHPEAARVVMTAHTQLEDIVRLVNDGQIHAFVLKPWQNEQLAQTVGREVAAYQHRREIQQLRHQLERENSDMMGILRSIDPDFHVPRSNEQLKETKLRLRQRVASEVEKLFLEDALANRDGTLTSTAESVQINRTFLYRLMRRHGYLVD